MPESERQRIIRFDLLMGFVAVVNGLMIASSMRFRFSDLVVGVIVALLTAVLVAGADRSRPGIWLLTAVGVLAIGALVTVGIEPWVIAVLPSGMVGLGVGWLLNRVLFGVIGSIPEYRVERGFWTMNPLRSE